MSEKTDKLISDLSKKIVLLTVLVLILLVSLAYVIFYKINTEGQCAGGIEQPRICGNALNDEKATKDYNSQNTTKIAYTEGAELFKQNCAVCHSINSFLVTGPGLEGIANRAPSKEWLVGYIINCDSVFKSGDPYAKKLRTEFPDSRMTDFSKSLTEEQAKAIVAYISVTVVP